MWNSIFLKGYFEQKVCTKCKEVDGAMISLPDSAAVTYDAFNRDDLIPSLTRLVDKVSKKGNWKGECKKWFKQNGSLTVPWYMLSKTGQSLEEFWTETLALVELWRIYAEAVNRDFEALKSRIKIKVEPLTRDQVENEEFFWGEGNDGRVCINGPGKGERYMGISLDKIKEDPLLPYQLAALHHVSEKACYNAGDVMIKYGNIKKHHGSDTDSFSVQAYLQPACLIQALYLQFLQLLTENRKVCPTCWSSFTVNRKDKTFCSNGCRYTYHTRKNRMDKKED